jgi:hypothetical protein
LVIWLSFLGIYLWIPSATGTYIAESISDDPGMPCPE